MDRMALPPGQHAIDGFPRFGTHLHRPPPAAPAAPALTNCGGVYAGPNTSCPFAVNVEQTWLTSGATDTFSVYSPVTGLSYVMTCGGIDPTVCTGGNNALVEFYN